MMREVGMNALRAAVGIAVVMGGVLVGPRIVSGEEKAKESKPLTAKAAFTRLKALAGTWKGTAGEQDKDGHFTAGKVIYRVTGGGSALTETLFPDSDHEMVSVYHLDGEDLRMTHYCAAGNQPHLKLDRANSSPDRLVFIFDGGTNLDPSKDMHIHGLTMVFDKDGKIACSWDAFQDGKKVGSTDIKLSRAQP